MTKTTNGDQIVQKKLDDLITTDSSQTGEAKSYDYKLRKFENFNKINIDFSSLNTSQSSKSESKPVSSKRGGVCIVKDILRLSNEKRSEVLLHPVIQIYIDENWKRIKPFIWGSFFIYALFLFFYCLFLRNIFYRPLHDEHLIRDLFSYNDSRTMNSNLMPKFGPGTTPSCKIIHEFCSKILCTEPESDMPR